MKTYSTPVRILMVIGFFLVASLALRPTYFRRLIASISYWDSFSNCLLYC